ncbi:MAG: hypothetical protein K5837_00245 [Candidatus Saccharibacteria bacterium]|nr:hypothetical protein [Candidatus Saccharibacteria bacterium]
MASNVICGTNYSLDAGTVDFFGARGMHFGDGWAINTFGGNLMVEVVKTHDTLEGIKQCIKGDTDAGKRDKIAFVIVGKRAAVALYLEGIITAEHLRKASEGPDYVDIPDVNFEDLSLTVRVDASRENLAFVATADKDCTIIE